MSKGPRYRVSFRRRREGRTDYRRRLALLKSHKTRAVVRKTLGNTLVQIIHGPAAGDRIVASAFAKELGEFGWSGSTGNVPAAYLTGYLAGLRARSQGIKEAVLDLGLHPPSRGGRVFAALRGLLDAGLAIPHGEEMLPGDERVKGEHISKEIPSQFEKVKKRMEAAHEAA